MTITATIPQGEPMTAPVRVVCVARSFAILTYTEQEARNAGTVSARYNETVVVERIAGPFGAGLYRFRVTLRRGK